MDQKYKFLNYLQNVVRESYSNIHVSFIESSYVNRLTGINKMVYLIHKQIKNSPTAKCAKVVENDYKMETDESELDLTGSPLKDDCDMDIIENYSFLKEVDVKKLWTKMEENYQPIDTNTARKITNKISFENRSKETFNSIWILVDDVTQPLLSIQLKAAWNSRGLVKYQNIVPLSDVTPAGLQKIHTGYIKGPNTTQIESTFQVQSNIDLIVNYSLSSLHTESFLRLPTNSEFRLNQTISMARLNSKTSELWENLTNLSLIFEKIKNFDNFDSSDASINSSVQDMDTVKRSILAILANNFNEEDRNEAGDEDEYSAVLNTQDLIGNIVKLKKQKQKSVLDKLWDLLKYFPYEQCTFAFKILSFHVFKNKTDIVESNVQLSKILSKIAKNDFSPSLSVIGSEPLHLLLEIGIEKMLKDYEFIFTESNICSEYDFTAFATQNLVESLNVGNMGQTARKTLFELNAKKSMSKDLIDPENETVFNEKEMATKLAKLGHIHILLEHLLLAQHHFNMKNVNIAIFKKMIGEPSIPLISALKMENHHLSLQIAENSRLLTFLKDITPSSMRIIMASERKECKFSNTFYYSLEEIMPYFVDEDRDITSLQKKEYHCYHNLQIETRKLL